MSEKFFYNPEGEKLSLQNRISLPEIENIRPKLDNEVKIRI